MHLGELLGGLSVYFYQKTFLHRKGNNKEKYKIESIVIIRRKEKMGRPDGFFKIFFLIFFSAYFDFVESILLSYYVPQLIEMSPTADLRLNSASTISSCLIFIFTLKLDIGKHHIFSLVAIGICLLLINITEFIYQNNLALFGKLFLAYLLIYFSLILIPITDLIEKYLTSFDFMNPMLVLAYEAVFGIVFMFFDSFLRINPFGEIIESYKYFETGKFILFIFLVFLYFIFCAGISVCKIYCTVFYSQMYKTIGYYILNPLLLIFSFFVENDFLYEGKRSAPYLMINILLALLITFFGSVYNEFIILYFCGLENGTYKEIANRSNQTKLFELKDIDDNDDDIIITENNTANAGESSVIY